MRTRIPAGLIVAALVVSMLLSCSQRSGVRVSLDETPVISGGLGWSVITLAYVRLKTKPAYDAADSGTGRRGDVARIVGRSRSFSGRDAGIWYRLQFSDQAGWVHESSVQVYESDVEARMAAAGIH